MKASNRISSLPLSPNPMHEQEPYRSRNSRRRSHRRRALRAQQHQQVHLNLNIVLNPNVFLIPPNPNILPQFNPKNSQNPTILPMNVVQQLPIHPYSESSSFLALRPNECNDTEFGHVGVRNATIKKIDHAARRARKDLLNSNKSVSAWKVSQEALLAVKAESWENLGYEMQQVPSLKSLMVTEGKALDRMLLSNSKRRKKQLKRMFASYPFVGLLDSAVACIKLGLWDNIDNTFQIFSQQNIDDKPVKGLADYISIDVQSVKTDAAAPQPEILAHKHDIVADDVVKKISGYFEDDVIACKSPSRENRFRMLRKLLECEYWLIEQYSADIFGSLGYGEYLMFLEKYFHMLPHALQKHILGGVSENVSLEAHLLPIQLDVFLSQAFDNFHENGSVSIQNISELLARQFPLVCFKLVKSDLNEDFMDNIRKKRCNLTSNSVLFSIPLSRPTNMGNPFVQNDEMEDTSEFTDNVVRMEGNAARVTRRDAIEVLLRAPMLADLKLWSHWDILFAPYLGSIVEWLLKEVNIKELQCLVTKDGKVIRLDHSATLDSFLKALVQESSFETAVQLLSLFALYGGEQSVPLSLLKCHARKTFQVIINKYLEMEFDNRNPLMHERKTTSSNSGGKFLNNMSIINKAAPVLSRVILDALSYLPVEFCSLAADVLIAGLQSFVYNVPLAVLAECKHIEERLILHDVGLCLGLLEWVNDYQSFRSSVTAGSTSASFCLDVVSSDPSTSSMVPHGKLDVHPSSGEMQVSFMVSHHDKEKSVSAEVDSANLLVLHYCMSRSIATTG